MPNVCLRDPHDCTCPDPDCPHNHKPDPVHSCLCPHDCPHHPRPHGAPEFADAHAPASEVGPAGSAEIDPNVTQPT